MKPQVVFRNSWPKKNPRKYSSSKKAAPTQVSQNVLHVIPTGKPLATAYPTNMGIAKRKEMAKPLSGLRARPRGPNNRPPQVKKTMEQSREAHAQVGQVVAQRVQPNDGVDALKDLREEQRVQRIERRKRGEDESDVDRAPLGGDARARRGQCTPPAAPPSDTTFAAVPVGAFTYRSNQSTKRAHMSRLFSMARGVCDSYGYSYNTAVFPRS